MGDLPRVHRPSFFAPNALSQRAAPSGPLRRRRVTYFSPRKRNCFGPNTQGSGTTRHGVTYSEDRPASRQELQQPSADVMQSLVACGSEFSGNAYSGARMWGEYSIRKQNNSFKTGSS